MNRVMRSLLLSFLASLLILAPASAQFYVPGPSGASASSSTSSSGFTVVAESTLVAAATEFDVTGLDIDADGVYYVQLMILGASAANLNCRFNGETASTGYTRYRYAAGSVSNDSTVLGLSTSLAVTMNGIIQKITKSDGTVHISFSFHQTNAVDSSGVTKSFTTGTNLTRITLTATVTNAIGIGSTLRILRES